MHTSNTWLEKIEFGHFRLHRIEKDRKSIAVMIENGFSATSDNPDEFVKDYHVDDQILNFGITMADCYNQLQKNQGFITAHLHLRSSKPVSAKARKEALDSFSEEELLVASLSLQDLDEFLFTYAENYSKPLVDEAKVHLDKGLDVFAQWLSSDSVEFREDSKQSIADYFALDRERFRDDICKKVFSGWEEAKKNEKAYEEWKDRFENDECWVNFYRSMGLDDESDNVEVDYTYYYCFSGNRVADELFEILNEKDPHYSTQTKRLIHNVLTDRSKKDIEFARELQCKYDEYRAVNGGKERTFITIAADETAKETQQSTPQIEEPVAEEPQPEQLSAADYDQETITVDPNLTDRDYETFAYPLLQGKKKGRHRGKWYDTKYYNAAEDELGDSIKRDVWPLIRKHLGEFNYPKCVAGESKRTIMKNLGAALIYYAAQGTIPPIAKDWNAQGVKSSYERAFKRIEVVARNSVDAFMTMLEKYEEVEPLLESNQENKVASKLLVLLKNYGDEQKKYILSHNLYEIKGLIEYLRDRLPVIFKPYCKDK